MVSFIRAEIGIGESGRLAARSLQTAEIPFGIINFPMVVSSRAEDTSWIHKEISAPVYPVNLFHMNADSMVHANNHFGNHVFGGRYNIGYWHWELPEFPDQDVPAFSLVNEIWVPTTFIQESVSAKSPVPVIKIPHGIHVDVAPELNRDTFNLPRDRHLFYSMYDTQSYQPRKNPQAVIEAFKLAFDKDDPTVGLVVKLNNSNFKPSDLEVLYQHVAGYNNIILINQIMNRLEVNSLLNCMDCFVSLHRSEGFGLGLTEAMFLGKPVIGTNWSGNTEFMNETNSCPVSYTLQNVGQDWGPYKAHQIWAEPDINHAASFMRELVNNPEWRNMIAANGQSTIHTQYSPQVSGQMMKQRLTDLGLL